MSNSKLYVGGLSWNTTDDQLKDYFSQVGQVIDAVVIKDRDSGRSKGFGFVEYSSEEEANAAIEKFNGTEFDGRSITVNMARPQRPREDRPRY